MSTDSSPAEQRDHFFSLLKKFRTAMLITWGSEHRLHARPMAIARVEDDGRMWFITGADTAKIHEIEYDSQVFLTAQDDNNAFLSLTGRATLIGDHEKISELWRDSFRTWFPGGKDDPNIELIVVHPERGEFWDATALRGARYLWEAAKARLTGTVPDLDDTDLHGAVHL